MSKFVLSAVVILVLTPLMSVSSAEPVEGRWIGTLGTGSNRLLFRMELVNDQAGLSGKASLVLQGGKEVPLTGIEVNGARLRFVMERNAARYQFDGSLEGMDIVGAADGGSGPLPFRFTRVGAESKLDQFAPKLGLFELGPNWVILVTFDEFGPAIIEPQTGRVRTLFPRPDSSFFVGSALFDPVPVETELTFKADGSGKITGLVWRDTGRPPVTGRKLNFRKEEVRFTHENIALSGTLVVPNTAGPYPAIVRVHGAGAASRLTQLAEWWAYYGVALLSYDKRGVGQSTGEWRDAAIEDLAGDAVAAVDWLARRTDIDAQRIGIIGGSEGGWVAPEAARQSERVAFVIASPASGLSLGEQIIVEIRNRMEAQGFVAEDIDRAVTLRRQLNAAIVTGQGWEQLRATISAAQKTRWLAHSRTTWAADTLDSSYIARQRRYIGYDPMRAWAKVRCPVLIMVGDRDDRLSLSSLDTIREALRRNSNPDVTIEVFPRGSHVLMEATIRSLDEYPWYSRYVPGVFDTYLLWLLPRIRTSASR